MKRHVLWESLHALWQPLVRVSSSAGTNPGWNVSPALVKGWEVAFHASQLNDDHANSYDKRARRFRSFTKGSNLTWNSFNHGTLYYTNVL